MFFFPTSLSLAGLKTWHGPGHPWSKPPSLLPNPRQPTALAVDIPLANSPLARLPRNFWEAEDPSGVLFGSFCFRWGAMSTLNLEETNSFQNCMFSALLGKFVELVAQPLSSLNGVMAQWGFCLTCDVELPMAKTHSDHPTGQVGWEVLVSLSQNEVFNSQEYQSL